MPNPHIHRIPGLNLQTTIHARMRLRLRSLRRRKASAGSVGGFTLIELLIVIAVISILVSIAIPNLVSSQKAARETSAIGSMRTLNSGEAVYRFRNLSYGDMAALLSQQLIDGTLANATNSSQGRSGYYFVMTVTAATAASQYWISGLPASSYQGDRQFYTDESGVIYSAPAAAAAPTADTHGVAPNAAFLVIPV